jgi:hypothetical protein
MSVVPCNTGPANPFGRVSVTTVQLPPPTVHFVVSTLPDLKSSKKSKVVLPFDVLVAAELP